MRRPVWNANTGNTDNNFHASHRTTGNFGTTDGCPASSIVRGRGDGAGRVGLRHSHACRDRVIEFMQNDQEYNDLVARTKMNVHDGDIKRLGENSTEVQTNHARDVATRISNTI